MADDPGNTAPPPSGSAEIVLLTTSLFGVCLFLVFLDGGSMDPKRKSFLGAEVVVVEVVAVVDVVDFRFPRGKA